MEVGKELEVVVLAKIEAGTLIDSLGIMRLKIRDLQRKSLFILLNGIGAWRHNTRDTGRQYVVYRERTRMFFDVDGA